MQRSSLNILETPLLFPCEHISTTDNLPIQLTLIPECFCNPIFTPSHAFFHYWQSPYIYTKPLPKCFWNPIVIPSQASFHHWQRLFPGLHFPAPTKARFLFPREHFIMFPRSPREIIFPDFPHFQDRINFSYRFWLSCLGHLLNFLLSVFSFQVPCLLFNCPFPYKIYCMFPFWMHRGYLLMICFVLFVLFNTIYTMFF